MTIYWATRLRGFLRHVSEHTPDVTFVDNGQYYEISNNKANFKSKLIRSRALDLIGLFQRIHVSDKNCDYYGSFNRFLKTDKPYFIYLENPTALYHYALGRLRYPTGRRRFRKCLEDPNLKYIVCMSEACRTTFEKINMPLPAGLPMQTIYPLVPLNPNITEDLIREKSQKEILECLYCVQGKRFYTKGGRDVLEAVIGLQEKGYKIHLTVITNIELLREDTLKLIQNRSDITLYNFTFSYDQMEKIYAQTAVLLHPSSDDSSALTVLEAMKGGCAILGSKIYAIPEMVRDGENGYLIDPLYWTFTSGNIPNVSAWGYENKVRLSDNRSQKYIDDIEYALCAMYEDRDKLYTFSKRSWEIANTKFSEDVICDQWKEIWRGIERKPEYEV